MLLEKVKNKLSYLRTKRFISKYEKSLQKRLKNDNFTILASNCASRNNIQPFRQTVFVPDDKYVV